MSNIIFKLVCCLTVAVLKKAFVQKSKKQIEVQDVYACFG